MQSQTAQPRTSGGTSSTARRAGARIYAAKAITPVDVHIGQRLRMRRELLGTTQEQLAEALGITFQQVQKYENGTNRISASRLFRVAEVLSSPVSYFFEGLATRAGEADQVLPMTHEEHDLLVAFRQRSRNVRHHLVGLARAARGLETR